MSEFNEYARKLNEAFKLAADKQKEAYTEYKKALDAKNAGADLPDGESYPGQRKTVEAGLEATLKIAKGNLEATQRDAWRDFQHTREKLGHELEQDVRKKELLSPAALDPNAVTLLNSNIISCADLENMAEQYAGNATMRRMVGERAERMAESEKDPASRQRLNLLAHRCKNARPEILREWDDLARVSAYYSGENERHATADTVDKLAAHWLDDDVQDCINQF